jgi:acetolactate synthase-1/2/3 large subunit
MATVADHIVQSLCDAGVRALFGVPGGGSNLDLIAAAGRAGLPFVLTATETAGAMSAIAQAEITGAPGACLTTLGPGATSVVNGIACAFLERAPLVVFTDSLPASAPYAHQRVDHGALLKPVTKSSETLTVERACDAITRALHTATDGQPGPVHLDCPGNVASAPAPTVGFGSNAGIVTTHTPVSRLEAVFAAAHRPLLLVGLGAIRGREDLRVADLCAQHRVPAMVTYKAKGVIPDDHAWFAGIFTNAKIEQPLIDQSDLLIGVGLDPVELIPRAWTRKQPIVYFGSWRADDDHIPFDVQVIGAHHETVTLLDSLVGRTEWDPSAVARDVQRQRDLVARADDTGFTAQRVIEIAAKKLVTVGARVTVDAGAHMFPATVLWPVGAPRTMLISNGLSTMGFALPAAIGAALLDRERPVIALTGDGGLLMCMGELLTAAREQLPIVTIVFADDSLSLIEIKQQARKLPPFGVALGGIDWQAIARGFGIRGFGATNGCELERAIDAARESRAPALIEARIDRSNYGETMRAIRG